MAEQAGLRWRVNFKEHTFEFDPQTDLTGRRLRQLKRWFGAQYGQYTQVVGLLAMGDVDAWASVIWICLDNAGLPKPSSPEALDFPIGELMSEAIPDKEEEGEESWDEGSEDRPTSLPAEETNDSDGTSTDSGDDSSSQ